MRPKQYTEQHYASMTTVKKVSCNSIRNTQAWRKSWLVPVDVLRIGELLDVLHLFQNYQEHGSHSIEKSNEGTDKEILNFKDLADDKAYQLHIHKDLASNHEVVGEISVFIELNVDEFCKPMRQVPNAFSRVHGCLKAKSIQYKCSRENENNIFFVVWIWLRDDLSNK